MVSSILLFVLVPFQEPLQPQFSNQQIPKPPIVQKKTQKFSVVDPQLVDPVKIRSPKNQASKSRFLLEDQSLEEIRKIRDRIGIKLFDDPTSQKEFAKQLKDVNQSNAVPAARTIQDSPNQAPRIQNSRNQLAAPNLIAPVITVPNQALPNPAVPRIQGQLPIPRLPMRKLEGTIRAVPVFKDPAITPASGLEPNSIPSTNRMGNPRSRGSESTRRSTAISSLIATVESLDRYSLELELQGEVAKSKKMRKLGRKIRKQLLELTNARDN